MNTQDNSANQVAFALVTPLLRHLTQEYNKDLKPELGPPCEKNLSVQQQADKIKQRYDSSHGCVKQTNHGALHHYRQVNYIPFVMQYYKDYGLKPYQTINTSLSSQIKFMLCMAFSSICRYSEINFRQQRETHLWYRELSGKTIETYYKAYTNIKASQPSSMPEHLKVFAFFNSDEEFKKYQQTLVAMGAPDDHSLIHCILNTAHKLDLYRCRTPYHAELDIDRYIRQHSDQSKAYGYAFHQLTQYAQNLIIRTGDSCDIRKVTGIQWPIFNSNATNVDTFINTVKQLDAPLWHPSNECQQQAFFHKSINNSDARDFWVAFIVELLKSNANKSVFIERIAPLHFNRSHKRYIVTTAQLHDDEISYTIKDRQQVYPKEKKPEKKAGYSANQSMSFCDPQKGFCPAPFWQLRYDIDSNFVKNECALGIKINPNHVMVTRVYSRDANTTARHMETDDANAKTPPFLLKSIAELTQYGILSKPHDILARLCAVDGILIYIDSLKTRFQAICRKNSYTLIQQQYSQAIGQPTTYNQPLTIEFYTPNNHGTQALVPYPPEAQIRDYQHYLQTITPRLHINYHFDISDYRLSPEHHHAAQNNWSYFVANPSADINCLDIHNKTPLHHAAQNTCLETCIYLLEKGAKITLDAFPIKKLSRDIKPIQIATYHDTFFSATLRKGRYDFALVLIDAIRTLTRKDITVITTLDQYYRILQPKNYYVIDKLFQHWDLENLGAHAVYYALINYANKINKPRLCHHIKFTNLTVKNQLSLLNLATQLKNREIALILSHNIALTFDIKKLDIQILSQLIIFSIWTDRKNITNYLINQHVDPWCVHLSLRILITNSLNQYIDKLFEAYHSYDLTVIGAHFTALFQYTNGINSNHYSHTKNHFLVIDKLIKHDHNKTVEIIYLHDNKKRRNILIAAMKENRWDLFTKLNQLWYKKTHFFDLDGVSSFGLINQAIEQPIALENFIKEICNWQRNKKYYIHCVKLKVRIITQYKNQYCLDTDSMAFLQDIASSNQHELNSILSDTITFILSSKNQKLSQQLLNRLGINSIDDAKNLQKKPSSARNQHRITASQPRFSGGAGLGAGADYIEFIPGLTA